MEGKRILAVHDLSCYGNASLGVALPVLTAFGYRVTALPSVLLSSTTDIDENPIALATTSWMFDVMARWNERGATFDAIYTGWLGDPRQVDLLAIFCAQARRSGATIFVDPVMGDGGVLYPCQAEVAKAMGNLVAAAHVITPNPTEAALLIRDHPAAYGVGADGTVTMLGADTLARVLMSQYPSAIPIITSVVGKNRIGVCVGFKGSSTRMLMAPRLPSVSIGGTGDLFASLLIARWLRQQMDVERDSDAVSAIIQSVVDTMSSVVAASQRDPGGLSFRALLHAD